MSFRIQMVHLMIEETMYCYSRNICYSSSICFLDVQEADSSGIFALSGIPHLTFLPNSTLPCFRFNSESAQIEKMKNEICCKEQRSSAYQLSICSALTNSESAQISKKMKNETF